MPAYKPFRAPVYEPPKDSDRAKAWCFTWNNAPDDWQVIFDDLFSYLVGGREIAPSTGTPHIQGYIEFTKRRTFSFIKSIAPTQHWEITRGTSVQASDYCKEDGDFQEWGVLSKPGKRNDLIAVRDALKAGGNMRTIVDSAESCQSIRYAEMYLKMREPKRTEAPYVAWLFGESGVGKTQSAMWHAFRLGFTQEDVYLQTGDSAQWWEGYDAHPVVIIDDIRDSFCNFNKMLNILDKYECRVPCKGASRQFRASHIFVTGPCHPALVWATRENQAQLMRRITVVQEIISHDVSHTEKGDAIPTCPPEDKDPSTGEDIQSLTLDEAIREAYDAEGGDEAVMDP